MTNNYADNDRLISKGNKQFETYLSEKFSPKITIGNNPSFWIFPSLFYDVRYVLFRRLYLLRFTWALCRITCNCCHYKHKFIYRKWLAPCYLPLFTLRWCCCWRKATLNEKQILPNKSHKRTHKGEKREEKKEGDKEGKKGSSFAQDAFQSEVNQSFIHHLCSWNAAKSAFECIISSDLGAAALGVELQPNCWF
jgi:hypothetical protein